MNILFTNSSLEHRAGAELVVVELATGMQKLGHRVAAYSTRVGEVGDLLRSMGIPVIREPRASPFVPDLIHGQHHLDTIAALCAFPGVPAIYHCHGYLPWAEAPPLHPRIQRYVGMCDTLSERIRIELNLPDVSVVTVPNWVDTRRFSVVREPVSVPRRALIFQGSSNLFSWHVQQLRIAFAKAGILLDCHFPAGFKSNPEVVLPNYDIVLASGRSALEAMACGCAVLPYHSNFLLDFVEPHNFEIMRAQNFAPRLHSPRLSHRSVSACLARYNPESVAQVTLMIREKCSLDVSVQNLNSLYNEAASVARASTEPAEGLYNSELLAVSNYLRSLQPLVREHDRLKSAWDVLHDDPLRQLARILRRLQPRLERMLVTPNIFPLGKKSSGHQSVAIKGTPGVAD